MLQWGSFPDPFEDPVGRATPRTMGTALRWCERIMSQMGIYSSGLERVISFFITDIEIEGTDKESSKSCLDFLHDTLGISSLLRRVAYDYITYGNSITSLVVPFHRSIICPKCHSEVPFAHAMSLTNMACSWSNFKPQASCTKPGCGYRGSFTFNDRSSTNDKSLRVKRWNPHELEIVWCPYTEETRYVWKIPEYYRNMIRSGSPFQLERTPPEVIKAVEGSSDILFGDDIVFHAKEETLAGIINKGWGIPRLLSTARQAWYFQVLHRVNEAIGQDYILPFRVVTPAPRPGGASGGGMGSDPTLSMDLSGFRNRVLSMLDWHRQDPTSWSVLPYPIQYQALGADANHMVPVQLMDNAQDGLLASIGIPVEFYRGTMTLQSAPAALRLMESFWSGLVYVMNRFLQWLVRKVAVVLSWDNVTARLTKPSQMDDLNRQLAKLQLMASRDISRTSGLKSIGLLEDEEQRKLLEEEKEMAEASQEMQEELELSGLGEEMAAEIPLGGPPAGMPGTAPVPAAGGNGAAATGSSITPGGVPGQPDPVEVALSQLPRGPNQSITPQDAVEAADTIARMLFSYPETLKDSALRRLKQRDDVIWALVKSKLEEYRNNARRQGLAMAQSTAQQSFVPPA